MPTMYIFEIPDSGAPEAVLARMSPSADNGIVLETGNVSAGSPAWKRLEEAMREIRGREQLGLQHEAWVDDGLRMFQENIAAGDPLYIFAVAEALRHEYDFGTYWDEDGEDDDEAGEGNDGGEAGQREKGAS